MVNDNEHRFTSIASHLETETLVFAEGRLPTDELHQYSQSPRN